MTGGDERDTAFLSLSRVYSGAYAVAMELDDLRDLIGREETECVEYKRGNHDRQLIGKLISAISNSAALEGRTRGYVLWGLDDKTKEIVGTEFRPDEARKGNELLQFWLTQMLAPPPDFRFDELTTPQGRVVRLSIPAASSRPVAFQQVRYIRVASSVRRLDSHQAKEDALFSALSGKTFELAHCLSGVSAEDVDRLLDTKLYLERAIGLPPGDVPHSSRERAELLAGARLLHRDGAEQYSIPNVAALVLGLDLTSLPALHRKAPRVVRWAGTTRDRETDSVRGRHGYGVGFEGLLQYVWGASQSEHIGADGARSKKPMFPRIALREVIANALVHQDLLVRGAGPEIEIFDDRTVVTNPGAPLIEPLRFVDLASQTRNDTLSREMYNLGLCEERGIGMDRVFKLLEAAQLPSPQIETTATSTRVTLFARKEFDSLTREERVRGCYWHAVLRFHTDQVPLTNQSLRKRFDLQPKAAWKVSRVIKDAMDDGFLKKADPRATSKRHAKYIPVWA